MIYPAKWELLECIQESAIFENCLMCGVGKRRSNYFDEVSIEIFHGFLRKSLIAFRLDKKCLFWFPVVTTALLLLKGKGPIEETRYVIWHGMQGFSYCEGGTRKKVSLVHSTKMIFLSLRFVWSRQRLKVTKKKWPPSLHYFTISRRSPLLHLYCHFFPVCRPF